MVTKYNHDQSLLEKNYKIFVDICKILTVEQLKNRIAIFEIESYEETVSAKTERFLSLCKELVRAHISLQPTTPINDILKTDLYIKNWGLN